MRICYKTSPVAKSSTMSSIHTIMTSTPDTDMLTALHSTLHPILARLVEQKISEDMLSLTVSQFAEFYPALQEKLSVKDWEYLEVASMVFSHINPPIPFTAPMPPFGAMRGCAGWHVGEVESGQEPSSSGEADLLSQGELQLDIRIRDSKRGVSELTKICIISTGEDGENK